MKNCTLEKSLCYSNERIEETLKRNGILEYKENTSLQEGYLLHHIKIVADKNQI